MIFPAVGPDRVMEPAVIKKSEGVKHVNFVHASSSHAVPEIDSCSWRLLFPPVLLEWSYVVTWQSAPVPEVAGEPVPPLN